MKDFREKIYQVIEKDAETDRKKAVIEAEKEAQVAKIRYFTINSYHFRKILYHLNLTLSYVQKVSYTRFH